LQLASYVAPALPTPPASSDWSAKIAAWGAMLNHQISDCTCAAAGHMIQQWSAYVGAPVVPQDDQILQAYEALSGYVPGDESTDIGATMLDVLNYWRSTGIAGHKILAYVALEPKSHQDAMDAIYLFGNVYVGLNLPQSARGKTVWSVPAGGPHGDGEPGSWGGHTVPVVEYDPRGLTCISWGKQHRMTWQFYSTYSDEAYAVLSPDWIEKNGCSPADFSLATLRADLGVLQ
jgi:hypothetical protein